MTWQVAVIIAFLGMIGILAFLSATIGNEHIPLKILFVMLCFIVLLVGVGAISNIATAEGTTTATNVARLIDAFYLIIIISALLVFGYSIAYYTIYTPVKLLKQKRREEEEE